MRTAFITRINDLFHAFCLETCISVKSHKTSINQEVDFISMDCEIRNNQPDEEYTFSFETKNKV